MDSRERLTRCYFHKETDRPAVYSRTAFPANDPTCDRLKEYLNLHTELKLHWNGRAFESAYPVEHAITPYSAEYERVTHLMHTPAGDLTSSEFRSLKGTSGMHETYFIKTRKDAEKYLSLPIPEWNASGDVSSFFDRVADIGDRGIVEVSLGTNPGGAVVKLFGSENFAMMSVTDRDMIHELCEREMKMMQNMVKFLLERNIGPFFDMDGEEYIVPPVHGPADFYDFNVKYDKPLIDLVHDGGGRMHIHCHGSVKKVLQGFLDMGADVLHPFEPPPMGDITAAEAKEIIRGKICMEGNIQINRMYEESPEHIREETESLIAAAFDDHKGLIVSPSASPYIKGKGLDCFEQYKAMIDTVLQWKG